MLLRCKNWHVQNLHNPSYEQLTPIQTQHRGLTLAILSILLLVYTISSNFQITPPASRQIKLCKHQRNIHDVRMRSWRSQMKNAVLAGSTLTARVAAPADIVFCRIEWKPVPREGVLWENHVGSNLGPGCLIEPRNSHISCD